jgi:regulatory protein
LADATGKAALREAALRYLTRYAGTRASVLRVLHRRIERWESTVDGDRAEIRAIAGRSRAAALEVVEALAASGVIDDAAFAASRALSLARSGRARAVIGAKLRALGVADSAGLPGMNDEAQLAAALVFARRKRIGPFRREDGEAVTPEASRREAGLMARAGFPPDIARRALGEDCEAAEAMIAALRR